MTELRQPSRAEISGGVSETQHIAADIVTVHGGVASEIHIVNPSEVTIYGGTLNKFFYLF